MITIFKNLFEKRPVYVSPSSVLKSIKEGPKCLNLINQIRSAPEAEQEALKKQLPVICFGGRFKERRIEGLIENSKIVVLDLDDVDVTLRKKMLCLLPFVYSVFVSPSGKGLKVLIKVSTDNYLGHFKALSKEIDDVDESGKDISRACFMSYDPDLYLNENSELYTKVIESVYTDAQKYEKLKKWLEKRGDKFVEGNRNVFLAKLAGACNRFGLKGDFVLDTFTKEFSSSDFDSREIKQCVSSMYRRVQDHGTASFDEAHSEKGVDEILEVQITTRDIITAAEVREDLQRDYDDGTQKGETTHFPVLDEHFRWMKKELTALTGVPSSGKTTILLQLMLIKSVFDKTKWGILSLETFPPTFFYRELIRTLIGKPIEKGAPHRMTREEYLRALDFVNEYFFYIYPEKSAPSPEWTQARFLEAVIKHGVKGVSIDPHNSQSHDYGSKGGGRDLYIGDMLRDYQRFAIQNNLYFVDVAHPKSIGKNEDGTYKEPTADEISGGQIWWSCCDNILIFHRPSMPLDYQDTTCTLRSAKIKKQQLNGMPGDTTFQYDRRNGRYYENGYNPLTDFVL